MLTVPLGRDNRDQVDHFTLLNYSSKKQKRLYFENLAHSLMAGGYICIILTIITREKIRRNKNTDEAH